MGRIARYSLLVLVLLAVAPGMRYVSPLGGQAAFAAPQPSEYLAPEPVWKTDRQTRGWPWKRTARFGDDHSQDGLQVIFAGNRRSGLMATGFGRVSENTPHQPRAVFFSAPAFGFDESITVSTFLLGSAKPSSHLIFGPVTRSPPL